MVIPGAREFLPRPEVVPGTVVVVLGVAAAFWTSSVVGVSSLVAAVAFGVIVANVGGIRPSWRPGFTFAAKRLLRVGIVLLGLRLSLDEVRELGLVGVVTVVAVVLATFAGVQLFARLLGLSPGLGLLTATGFSICGASAVAAMEPLSDADDEETAYAIGLVTLCGTLSIAVLPLLGHALDLSTRQFGVFAGAAVHDVGQVTATASAYAEESIPSATLVKLTRVVLLAPMVAGVGLWMRAQSRRGARVAQMSGAGDGAVETQVARPPVVPLFVVLFLAAIALRATDWLSADVLSAAKRAEQAFLSAGMLGLGAGVVFASLRRLGGRPLVLGLVSWVLVAILGLGASYVIA